MGTAYSPAAACRRRGSRGRWGRVRHRGTAPGPAVPGRSSPACGLRSSASAGRCVACCPSCAARSVPRASRHATSLRARAIRAGARHTPTPAPH
ncbi:hypothetical protein G6F65_021935 [Rhizopus arrhizus]|nr:hypothetical protein G6F65_021935 [Rhizopus arrhizus]